MAHHEMSFYSKRLFLELADEQWHSSHAVRETLIRLIEEVEPDKYTRSSQEVAQRAIADFVRKGAIEREGGRMRVTPVGRIRVLKALGHSVEPPQKARQSPATKRLYEILSDGEWHDTDELLLQIMVMIPPEKGFRESIRNRESQARRRGYTIDLTRGDPHRSGQRSLARGVIAKQIKSGGIVREDNKIRAAMPGSGGYKLK